MLSVALPISLPFIIYVRLADHTLPFLCKSIDFFFSLFRCVLLRFSLSLSLLLNCSHTLEHKQVSLWVNVINTVQREKKTEQREGKASGKKRNVSYVG